MFRTPWRTRRREVGVAVLASALTTLVLASAGVPLLRQARAEAAAARRAAEEARTRAEANAQEADRQQARAEHNLRLAREALDHAFARLADRRVDAGEDKGRQRQQLLDEARRYHETL
jgi:hypothetical protein